MITSKPYQSTISCCTVRANSWYAHLSSDHSITDASKTLPIEVRIHTSAHFCRQICRHLCLTKETSEILSGIMTIHTTGLYAMNRFRAFSMQIIAAACHSRTLASYTTRLFSMSSRSRRRQKTFTSTFTFSPSSVSCAEFISTMSLDFIMARIMVRIKSRLADKLDVLTMYHRLQTAARPNTTHFR